MLALIEQAYYLDIEKAHEVAKLGVDKNPNSSWAWLSYAHVLLGLHREECLEAITRFAELEPLEMLSQLKCGVGVWLCGTA